MKIPLIGTSPIRKNISANVIGIFIHLINQILLIPFYIIYWGKELYSDWIIISSLTAFFTISDIGVNNVIQNRFAIKYSEGDHSECRSLITDNFALVSLIFIVIFTIAYVFVSICDLKSLLHIHLLSTSQTNIVFLLLLCRIFVDMYRGIENAIYRAVHKAHKAILLDQATNLTVAILTFMCLICGTPMEIMCGIILVPSCLMTVYKYFGTKSIFAYSFSFKYLDWGLLKQITLPAISFMTFPVGNAIILQGYTLVVNAFFGPASVVLYNTTRTMCNFSKTILNTLQNSVWPEYSIAYGIKDYTRMRRLHRKTIKTSVLASLVICLILLTCGPTIYKLWLHNTVQFNFSLMVIFCLALFTESLWMSSSVTLMSTNNHMVLGVLYILCSGVALGMAVLLGKSGHSISIITSTLIFSNLAMCVYSIRAGLKITKDRFSFKAI